MITKMDKIIASQCTIVDVILAHYISDEEGSYLRNRWYDMSEEQKMTLLTYTLETCSDWEDFEADLVVNFEKGLYYYEFL